MKLPTHDRVTQSVPDAMHTVKDVVEGIFHLVTGRDDTEKVRRSEASINRFGLHTSNLSSDVPYRLSGPQLKIAQGRVHHIRVPTHVDVNPRHLFSRSSKLKSHDWKQVQVLEYV